LQPARCGGGLFVYPGWPADRAGKVENMTKDPTLFLTEAMVQQRWYVTPAELATLTPLSEWTIRRAIYQGELKATQIRRRWLISTEDARRWIAEHGEPNVA
jgi:excisionase family DNA binding protein